MSETNMSIRLRVELFVPDTRAFLPVSGIQNTADCTDVDGDRANGIIVPTLYHRLRLLVRTMAVIAVFVFSMLAAFIHVDVLPTVRSLGVLAVPICWCLWKLWNAPDTISGAGGNHVSWFVYVSSLASMYTLPPIQPSLVNK